MQPILRRALSFPCLSELDNEGWKHQLSWEDRNKIRCHISAMLTSCFVARYALRLSDLDVKEYSKSVEERIFLSASSESQYISMLIYRLSELIGTEKSLFIGLEDPPIDLSPQNQELTQIVELRYASFDRNEHRVTRNDDFWEVCNWIRSIDQHGHPLLKKNKIGVINKEMKSIALELKIGVADEDRIAYLSRRFHEIKRLKEFLQQIETTMNSCPLDESVNWRLSEFLKAVILQRARERGLATNLRIGVGYVQQNLYGAITDMTNCWADYKLRNMPRVEIHDEH